MGSYEKLFMAERDDVIRLKDVSNILKSAKRVDGLDFNLLKIAGDFIRAGIDFKIKGFAKLDILLDRALGNLPSDSDGHPVYFIPGFISKNEDLSFWQEMADIFGYDVFEAYETRNKFGLGFGDRGLHVIDDIKRIKKMTGKNPTVVGHSMGGAYGYAVAHLIPNDVRQVIAVGAPGTRREVFELINNYSKETFPEVNHDDLKFEEMVDILQMPPKVPVLNIYSKYDQVVHHTDSFRDDFSLVTNLEVSTDNSILGWEHRIGHGGQLFNRKVVAEILRQLAAPDEEVGQAKS